MNTRVNDFNYSSFLALHAPLLLSPAPRDMRRKDIACEDFKVAQMISNWSSNN